MATGRRKERGLLRVALEDLHPLQQHAAPSCKIRAISVARPLRIDPTDSAKASEDDGDGGWLIYLGTDLGHLFLFKAESTVFSSQTQAPHGNPSSDPPCPDTSDLSFAHSQSPSPSPLPSPSLSPSPSPSPSLSLSPSLHFGCEPSIGSANEYRKRLALIARVALGQRPVDALCPLPATRRLVALVGNQVVLLDLDNLGSVEWLPLPTTSGGASAIARALAFTGTLQSSPPGSVENSIRKISRKGNLERLFGGRASGKQMKLSSSLMGGLPSPVKPKGERSLRDVDATAGTPRRRSASLGQEPTIIRSAELVSSVGNIAFSVINIERLVVAVGKNLILFEVQRTRQRLEISGSGNVHEKFGEPLSIKLKQIPCVEGVLTIAWLQNVIITGTLTEYMLYSVEDGQATLLFSIPQDKVFKPLIKPLPRDGEVLVLMDKAGIVINSAGQPSSGTLVFKDIPEAVAEIPPYIVTIKQGLIELYHRRRGTLLQSIIISSMGSSQYFLAEDDDSEFVVAANETQVCCLERIALAEQLRELLAERKYEAAVELSQECALEDEDGQAINRLSMVHAQAGFLLFFDLHFEEAVHHLLQSDAIQPSEVFPFYPHLTKRWRGLVPRKRYWGLHPPPQALQLVIENRLQAIQRATIVQTMNEMSNVKTDFGILPVSAQSRSAVVEKYYKQATEQLVRYLKSSRERSLELSMKQGVDTLLMKLYIQLGSTKELEKLAASENFCVVEEVEDLLKDSGQLRSLAFLYESAGKQISALRVWRSIAQSLNASPLTEASPHESTSTSLEGSNELPSSQLFAAREASRILEPSEDGALVLDHLTWIKKISPESALRMLCSQKRSKLLPHEMVFAAFSSDDAIIQQRYLHWLIQDQGLEDSQYHTLYALTLAASIIDSISNRKEFASLSRPSSQGNASGNLSVMRSEESSRVRNREDAAINDAEYYDEKQGSSRRSLQQFLESSKHYNPESVLAHIGNTELWHEQATLYRRLGDEMSVFRILALKLQDTEGAEHYCNELGRPDAYMRLLGMYLNPGNGREPMLDAAMRLLNSQHSVLDPLQILEALPQTMPLSLIYETLSRMWRTHTHRHRQGQVVKQLSRADNFEARIARLEERSRNICVDRSQYL